MSISRDCVGCLVSRSVTGCSPVRFPDRGAKRGVVGEAVEVKEFRCDRFDQAVAMFGVAKQDDTRVPGKPLIVALDIVGAVEIGLGQVIERSSPRGICSISGNMSTATRPRREYRVIYR
jgi:hypothetical protein